MTLEQRALFATPQLDGGRYPYRTSWRNYKWRTLPPVAKGVIAFLVIATLIRFWVSARAGVFFWSFLPHDDVLFVQYADIRNHFTSPRLASTWKTLSYPVFLAAVSWLGLNVPFALTLIWFAVAIIMVLVAREIFDNPYWLAFIYLFVLWNPVAFDIIGTRLHRFQLMAPAFYLLFAAMLLLLVKVARGTASFKQVVWLNIAITVFAVFAYFIQETGVWMVPAIALNAIACLLIAAKRKGWYGAHYQSTEPRSRSFGFKKLAALLTFLLPVSGIVGGTLLMEEINYRYFGVRAVTTSRGSEIGGFVDRVYAVATPNRTPQEWAPVDAIAAAIAASPTFTANQPLAEALLSMGTPPGDHLTWRVQDAIARTMWGDDHRLWANQVQAFFHDVNTEIDQAFANGTLARDNRIQIISSGPGRTWPEIFDLVPRIGQGFINPILVRSYQAGAVYGDNDTPMWTELARVVSNSHVNIMEQGSHADNLMGREHQQVNAFIDIVFALYRVVNPLMALAGIAGFIMALIHLIRYRRPNRGVVWASASAILAMVGLGAAYTFAIAWFADFLMGNLADDILIMNGYSVGMVPLSSAASVIGASLIFYLFSNRPKPADLPLPATQEQVYMAPIYQPPNEIITA